MTDIHTKTDRELLIETRTDVAWLIKLFDEHIDPEQHYRDFDFSSRVVPHFVGQ